MTSRDWLLTVWQEHDDEPKFNPDKCKYLIFNPEKCPTTGNPHWQTYAIFHQPVRIRGAQRALGVGKKCQVIKPRGSGESCATYCSKLKTSYDKFKEFGEMPTEEEIQQGRRNDLHGVKEACLKPDASETEIALQFPEQYIKYHAGIGKLIQHSAVMGVTSEYTLDDFQHWKPLARERSQILLGKAGIGKTEFAKAHFECPLFVTHMDDLLGFNPSKYDGIIFDDMCFRHMPRTAQIAIVDWDNPRSIHCRYRTANIPKHTRKIFTCNEVPFDLSDKAISRRVTVTEVTERVII